MSLIGFLVKTQLLLEFTQSNWVNTHLTQTLIRWVWVQLQLMGLGGHMGLDLFCHLSFCIMMKNKLQSTLYLQ